ncbi:hypothetical protein M5K25_000246 [Dendrobium thyrsiflorum]|uniref:Uncharacterized protein n=1 Tax=Dendrobium thyrsiflorum TaxID=117978 RepID=A0ABD0VV46_DENTH
MKEVDDFMIQRFLRSRDSNLEKASDMFLKFLKWRNTVPNDLVMYYLDKICDRRAILFDFAMLLVERCQETSRKLVSIVDFQGWGYSNCDILGYLAALDIMQKSINRALISLKRGAQGRRRGSKKKKKKRREEGKEGRNSSSTTVGFRTSRKYKPNDTKFKSIRAQMSPNQGPEALLEGSNHNLSYQTVCKWDVLIVESSGSTRRIQRAQDR